MSDKRLRNDWFAAWRNSAMRFRCSLRLTLLEAQALDTYFSEESQVSEEPIKVSMIQSIINAAKYTKLALKASSWT
jgi:hypothetical protein